MKKSTILSVASVLIIFVVVLGAIFWNKHTSTVNTTASIDAGVSLAQGRELLLTCQHSEGEQSSACEEARKRLIEICRSGSIPTCDVIFQADELIPLREPATQILEDFCAAKKPQACKTFEVALRNRLDLDKKAGAATRDPKNPYRTRYIQVANENCDRGFYFSCLALIDEDGSTASKEAIQKAESRLQAICDKAADRFEKDDCVSYAEYLALTDRHSEGGSFSTELCAAESEAGCLTALRIQLDLLKKHEKEAEQFAAVKQVCADSKKAAVLTDYCKAFDQAIAEGVKSWPDLLQKPALLESSHKVTFEELLTIKSRETY